MQQQTCQDMSRDLQEIQRNREKFRYYFFVRAMKASYYRSQDYEETMPQQKAAKQTEKRFLFWFAVGFVSICAIELIAYS